MQRRSLIVGLLALVLLLVALGGLFVVYLKVSQRRVATPLGNIGAPAQEISFFSYIPGKTITFTPDTSFREQLLHLAPKVKKVEINFHAFVNGQAVHEAPPTTGSTTKTLIVDPVIFQDTSLGTYGYFFSYIDGVALLDVSLDDMKITTQALNQTIPVLVLSVAKYANSLNVSLPQPGKIDIETQVGMTNELNKLKLGSYQLFTVQ